MDIYKNSVLQALNSAVIEVFGHPLEYYDTPSRKRELVEVRQMTMDIYRDITGYSLREVGEIFGRNHSTVAYACKQCDDLFQTDRAFARDYNILTNTIKKYL